MPETISTHSASGVWQGRSLLFFFFLYLSREGVAEVMGMGDRIERHKKVIDISNFTRCRSGLGIWNARKGNAEETNTSLLKRGKAAPMCGLPRDHTVSSLRPEPYQTWSKLRKCNTCRLDCSYGTSRVCVKAVGLRRLCLLAVNSRQIGSHGGCFVQYN